MDVQENIDREKNEMSLACLFKYLSIITVRRNTRIKDLGIKYPLTLVEVKY